MNVIKLAGGFFVLIAFIFFILPVSGQEQPQDQTDKDAPSEDALSVLLLRLDNVIGMPVVLMTLSDGLRNAPPEAGDGIKVVGELNDLVVLPDGEITHALVNFSQNPGNWSWWTGSGEYLLPIAALSEHQELRNLVLDRQRLDGQKISKVQDDQNLALSLAADFVRIRDFIDYRVVDINDEAVGTLEDLTIDFKQYKIVQLILALDNSFKGKNKYYAFSFKSIRYDNTKKEVQLYFSRSLFDEKKGWDLDQWLKSVNTSHAFLVSWMEQTHYLHKF